MSKVSVHRLLSKLTALALSTSAVGSAVGSAAADAVREPPELDASDDGELDASLQIDREHLDVQDAASAIGRSLALALGGMRPLLATHLAATWSLSSDPVRRLAVAHALERTFLLVGDGLVIDHLSHDSDPSIRAAAARAAWARRPIGGDPGVLT